MTDRPAPLHGVTILDLTTTEAGRFCGTLLADMGATVTRIEGGAGAADDGDPFVATVLLRNRTLLTGDATALFRAEAARHQVLLTDEGSDGLAPVAEAETLNPALIRCRVSPFGADGPWAARQGGDLVVQALSGFMELTGEPGQPPIRMGPRVLPLMAGGIAAVQIMAELAGGCRAAAIDVSILDSALNTLTYMAPMYLTCGKVPGRVGSGHSTIYPYNAFRVSDGYIVAAPFTGRFWRNFCQALGAPEWGTDERFKDFQNRLDNRAILEPMLNGRMREKSRDEWLALLDAADVPCGPVNTVGEAIEMEHSRARGLVAPLQDDTGAARRILGLPIRFSDADGRFAPDYRQSRDDRPAGREGVAATAGADSAQPLAGIRVLDLTRMAAGPYCTQMLVDLGAEVIKVEEPKIGDPTRRNVPFIGEMSSYFYAFNRGKKSVAVDMKTPEGNAVVRRLMEEVDVVVENFRPGVMERLKLDYARASRRNPGIVFASISGFGQDGPLREKISFDLVNQAMAGLMSITSEPGREPARLGMAVGDLGGGLFACLGIMAGLIQRLRTGKGTHVDVSLHDVLVSLLGSLAQDYLDTGVAPGPMGSQDARHVPERAFEAADGWTVLEAWTDRGWRALVALPAFEGLDDARFATLDGRRAHRDEIHGRLAAIIRARPMAHWTEQLDRPGIGFAPVVDVAGALDSAHVEGRDLVVRNDLAGHAGARTMGSAFRIDGAHVGTHAPPPLLGADSAALLAGVEAA